MSFHSLTILTVALLTACTVASDGEAPPTAEARVDLCEETAACIIDRCPDLYAMIDSAMGNEEVDALNEQIRICQDSCLRPLGTVETSCAIAFDADCLAPTTADESTACGLCTSIHEVDAALRDGYDRTCSSELCGDGSCARGETG